MLKNVVIVNDFNYVQGGASKIAIETARILKDKGINVYFFSAVNKVEENIEGITYITTNQNEALKERNKIKGAINGIYNLKTKKKLKQLLKQLKKDETVIHIHGWTKALSSSVFDIIFKMKYNVVLTLHDYFTACPNGGYFNYKTNEICHLNPLSWKCIKCNCDSRNYGFKLYRIIRQFVQNKIVKLNKKIINVISISNFSEEILKETLNDDVKITRIYNPIEIDKNVEKVNTKENQYYLYVGRIVKEKGVDIFCKAITELGYKGIAVGAGDEKDKLEKEYPNIEFTGWRNKEEVKKYMKGAKCLIFPSKWYETAGLTILEAQILGVPCIVSSNCAGSEFVIEGKNGWKFSNIEELKKRMNDIDNYDYEFSDVKRYSKEKYYENIIRLYKEILYK